MKFKYFLRGLGTGIIFSAIICLVAFQSVKSSNISDKEVIERAKSLGMTEKKEPLEETLLPEKKTTKINEKKNKKTEKESDDNVKSEETTEQKKEEKTEMSTEDQNKSEKDKEQITEQKTTEQRTTEEITTKQEKDDKKESEENSEVVKEEKKTVTITIKGGATSYPVCQKLQELGVVKDATDFDNYLIKNGYANHISVGTHILTIGMTYEEIAIAISDPR